MAGSRFCLLSILFINKRVKRFQPQRIQFLKITFLFTPKNAGGIFVFCAALVLAGVMMTYRESGRGAFYFRDPLCVGRFGFT